MDETFLPTLRILFTLQHAVQFEQQETRGNVGGPISLSYVSYPCALFLGSTSLPRCGVRQDGKEVSARPLALWPLAVPGQFSKRPLVFLWWTLGNEGVAVGLFLCSGNVLERQGLTGKKHGRQASTGDWIVQPVFATCQPPFNL